MAAEKKNTQKIKTIKSKSKKWDFDYGKVDPYASYDLSAICGYNGKEYYEKTGDHNYDYYSVTGYRV